MAGDERRLDRASDAAAARRISDLQRDYVRPFLGVADGGSAELETVFSLMESQAGADLTFSDMHQLPELVRRVAADVLAG